MTRAVRGAPGNRSPPIIPTGKQGFGGVRYPYPQRDETSEPLVRALCASALRNHIYNMDEQRHAIERMTPPYPFPDAAGHGMQAPAEPTYDVRFRSRDLWPDSCDDALNHVGVFQSYFEKPEQ